MREEIGGYRLVRRIGFGGMSTVYEAVDGAGTRVALKLLHPAAVDGAAGRERLRREVAMLQRVRGPYVAEVLDAETDDEDAFIVTQLVEGPTLAEDVRVDGPYPPAELVTLARQLHAAVTSVHRLGVLHRDLKPSNVMLGANGPVLIDFGIAQTGGDSRLTMSGAVTHTPGYLDPRVLRGHAPDEAADLWALAAVIAFAATGHDPYPGANPAVIMRRVLEGDVDVTGVPPRIAHALRAALAEPVEQRWGIDEVVAALADPVSWYDDAATAPRALPTQLDATVPAALPGAAAPSYNATDSVPSAFPETWPQPIYAGSATAPYPEASAYQQAAPGPAAPATAPYPEASAYQQAVPGPAAPFASQPEAAPYPGAAPLEPAPLEPAPLPPWARPPRRTPVLSFVLGGLLCALVAAWQIAGYVGYALVTVCLAFAERNAARLRRRRAEEGGPFRGEHLGQILRAPLTLAESSLSVIPLHGVGLLAVTLGYVAARLGGLTGPGAGTVAALAGVGISWLGPSGRIARGGSAVIFAKLAPTRPYRAFWAVVLAAGAAALALLALSGVLGVPAHTPLSFGYFGEPLVTMVEDIVGGAGR
ncbi:MULTISPECIES: serine/threonine-protein kinase [Actinotignum]|uniref:non-specific serine/threonine protein kinase n=3 Tax=Actinotignum timonense TaxID=1870995 RepID=A0AAW9HQR2_9ACTO|nr:MULTISPECIES: serine/threonine-protein kinase [Actinotignum]MDE1536747.1 serine/threonine-protein kinase [Actinotignum schaalii]MDE1559220.1 serine/threonine-protein kinase [Actinotignum schaalii]MDE1664209.1 serine/threonine-protein kinase [Actinotignum schaalii]MDK6374012.1 serine/threonine-protein kinase [Actinotignum timonense]MDK6419885.1 serine/threonine-protein kinase [Actinotignum timonense]